jgi:hypothetical protein
MKFLTASATLLFVFNGIILSSTAHLHGLINMNQGVLQPIRPGPGFMKAPQTMENCIKTRVPWFGRLNSPCYGLAKQGTVGIPFKTTPPIPKLKATEAKNDVKNDAIDNANTASESDIVMAILNAIADASKNVSFPFFILYIRRVIFYT